MNFLTKYDENCVEGLSMKPMC